MSFLSEFTLRGTPPAEHTFLLRGKLRRAEYQTPPLCQCARQTNRTVVHLLSYCAERRTPRLDIIEDIIPLRDVPVSLRLDKAPRRVYLAPPQQTPVPFAYQNGRGELTVPELAGHQMIAFE